MANQSTSNLLLAKSDKLKLTLHRFVYLTCFAAANIPAVLDFFELKTL